MFGFKFSSEVIRHIEDDEENGTITFYYNDGRPPHIGDRQQLLDGLKAIDPSIKGFKVQTEDDLIDNIDKVDEII